MAASACCELDWRPTAARCQTIGHRPSLKTAARHSAHIQPRLGKSSFLCLVHQRQHSELRILANLHHILLGINAVQLQGFTQLRAFGRHPVRLVDQQTRRLGF